VRRRWLTLAELDCDPARPDAVLARGVVLGRAGLVFAGPGWASPGSMELISADLGRAGAGSAASREVDGDRRAEELATRSPLGARSRRGRTQMCRRDRVRPAKRRGPGPSLISPAHQDAKLEDLKGLPGGRLGTARQFRPYLRV